MIKTKFSEKEFAGSYMRNFFFNSGLGVLDFNSILGRRVALVTSYLDTQISLFGGQAKSGLGVFALLPWAFCSERLNLI